MQIKKIIKQLSGVMLVVPFVAISGCGNGNTTPASAPKAASLKSLSPRGMYSQVGNSSGAGRFETINDCEIRDRLTGLIWLKDPALANGGNPVTYDQAQTLVKNGNWCGHSDWTLPNIRELQSLVNSANNDAGLLTGTGFATSIRPAASKNYYTYYITSTVPAHAPNKVYTQLFRWDFKASPDEQKHRLHVNFYANSQNLLAKTDSSSMYLLPVRYDASQPGQVKLLHTGASSDEASKARSTELIDNKERFKLAENNCVIVDTLTGLEFPKDWTQVNAPQAVGTNDSFNNLLKQIKDGKVCNISDWRIANFNEATSLVNYGKEDISADLQEIGFTPPPFSYLILGDIVFKSKYYSLTAISNIFAGSYSGATLLWSPNYNRYSWSKLPKQYTLFLVRGGNK